MKITSPKGPLEWVTISGEGKENLSGKLQYLASVVVDSDDPWLKKIEKFWQDNKPKASSKPKSNGIYEHKEVTGKVDGKNVYSLTGKKVLQFKTGTTFPNGKAKEIKVYNSKAQPVHLSDEIANGSIGRISGTMAVYTGGGASGVTLYLDSIQVIKLVTRDDGSNEFAEEEGGWEGETGFIAEEPAEQARL